MKPKYFLTVIVALFLSSTEAQVKKHFIKPLRKVTEKPTSYYRIYYSETDYVRFEDYASEKLVFEGRVESTTNTELLDKPLFDVEFSISHFVLDDDDLGALSGDFTSHNEKYVTKAILRNSKFHYYSIVDSSGTNILDKGNGFMQSSFDDFMEESSFLVFRDSLPNNIMIITDLNQDTIYTSVDQNARPKGGYEEFTTFLSKNLKYPFLKRLIEQEGRISVEFTVSKDGELIDFKATSISGNTTLFEKKTMKKMSKFPDWEPAILNGKPVASRFVQPIDFKVIDR